MHRKLKFWKRAVVAAANTLPDARVEMGLGVAYIHISPGITITISVNN